MELSRMPPCPFRLCEQAPERVTLHVELLALPSAAIEAIVKSWTTFWFGDASLQRCKGLKKRFVSEA